MLLLLFACVTVGAGSLAPAGSVGTEDRSKNGMFAFGKEQPKKVQSVLSAVEALDAALRGLPAELVPDFEKAAQELFDHHRTRDQVRWACGARGSWVRLVPGARAVTCRLSCW